VCVYTLQTYIEVNLVGLQFASEAITLYIKDSLLGVFIIYFT